MMIGTQPEPNRSTLNERLIEMIDNLAESALPIPDRVGPNSLRRSEYPFDDVGCHIQSPSFPKDLLEPTRFIAIARI